MSFVLGNALVGMLIIVLRFFNSAGHRGSDESELFSHNLIRVGIILEEIPWLPLADHK